MSLWFKSTKNVVCMAAFILMGLVALLSSASLASATTPPPHKPLTLEEIPHLAESTAKPASHAPDAPMVSPWYRLVFQSYRDNNWEIYTGNDDGSGQTRLTATGEHEIQPRFNRGATRIVHASRRNGNYDIYVMNANGTGVTRLTANGADDVMPYWSPDGSRIVFQSYRDGQAEVYAMNADGSGQTRLTNNSDYDGEPAWSPDGTQIAFISKRTSGDMDYWLWLMNADGTNQHLLAALPYASHPIWSPSGTKLALDVAGGDYWQNLWVINADGTNAHVVFDESGQADAWAGSWSPDERYIAFTRIYYAFSGGQLYWTSAYLDAADITTSAIIRLSNSGADWRPDWQNTDITAPMSSISPLPSISACPISVSWSGTDSQSGLVSYDVQVKDGVGGTWVIWQTATTATSGSYIGVGGRTYYFRVRARDNSGNLEAWPATPDASTTIEALPPQSSINALPAFAKYQVAVSWDGYDPGGSNIQTYDVQYRDGLDGVWTGWLTNTTSTEATFSGLGGHIYFFRSRAMDQAQNLENWPSGNGDASTQFYMWAITGTVQDNTGTPISGITLATEPVAQATFTDDLNGLYAAYVITDSAIYTSTWSKSGYGGLPPTPFEGRFTQMPSPQQGTLPAQYNGGPAFVTISNLVVGQEYRIVVKGTWEYTYDVLIDAQWAQHVTCSVPGDFCYYSPNVGFNGVYLSAQTGQSVVDSNHEYIYLWTADAPTLQLSLGDSQYWDNSGYLTFEIKLDSVGDAQVDAILPPENNAIANGDFEADHLDPWMTYGELTPTLTTTVRHTGHNSVLLGNLETASLGDSILSQVVTLSVEHPVLSFLHQSKYAPPAILQNLAAYWSLDETGGTRHDSTGAGNDLEDHNAVGGTSGKVTTAADFSPAARTYLNHVDNANLSVGNIDFTLAAWVYLTDKSAYRVIAGKGTSHIYAGQEFELFYTATDGAADRFGFFVQDGAAQGAVYANALGSPALNTWYYIVAWHDADSDSLNIQVNNGAVDSTPWSTGSQDSAAEFALGRRASYDTEFYWSGRIDEVGLWKRLLTSEERTALYNNGQGCAYPFFTCDWTSSHSGGALQAIPSFAIEVSDGITTSTLYTETLSGQDWTHRWLDLSAWAGQTATVTFKLNLGDTGTTRGAVYLDDVSIGSANADVWTTIKAPATSPRGTQVVYEVKYGNRGGAPTDGTLITATLPADLIDVQASLPPLTTTTGLAWDVGKLPAKSETYTLFITATVAPTATSFSTVVGQVIIEPVGAEIEKLNNVAMAESYVGWRTFLPIIQRY